SEKDKENIRSEIEEIRAEQNTVVIWITNSNGSQQTVKLRRQGPNFVGPRGEIYQKMPSSSDLEKVYAF
ncbi:MAG: hypothetical protein ACTSSP_03120, partial [Candidatus Asgardarchaeia archaeon]